MAQILTSLSACKHCGTQFTPFASQEFCCEGCKLVFDLIQDQGLSQYYEIREASPPVCPLPAQVSGSTFDYYDNPEFLKKISPDGKSIRFFIDGMNCTACLWLLEKLPQFCEDVEFSRVNMGNSTLVVLRKEGGSFSSIARTLNRLGYRPHPLKENENSTEYQIRERRNSLVRIGIAGALTGNIMILAVSLYAGASGDLATQFRWLSGVLAFPILTYCAWPFYKSAISSIRSRYFNLDVPIVVAILAGIFISVWGLFTSFSEVYFDSLSMLVFLLLSSRFVLKEIQHRQSGSSRLEDEILLSTVQKVNKNNTVEQVSSLELKAGDLIQFNKECIIPVDGVVVLGNGTIDVSVLTGESFPLQIQSGVKVEAGCRNLFGEWTMEVTHPASQTRIAQILRDSEESAQNKPHFVHLADTVSNWFIGIVLCSALALVIYFFDTDPYEGISRALALVIVTCPCVFGIAIPLSMSLALRGAARRGIIVKNADAIERLWKVKNFFFDKTGTLTLGQMNVLSCECAHASYLEIVLGLEKSQLHPVARCLVRYCEERNVIARQVDQVSTLPKGGVTGRVDNIVYSLKPVDEKKSVLSQDLKSFCGLYREDELVATFQISDRQRAEALEVLSSLRKNSLTTKIISGDRKFVVEDCAEKLGFGNQDFQSNISPEEKAQMIRNYKESSVMVGDGANDVVALAAADVGIAVCGSLDVSLKAADIYLTRSNLTLIIDLLKIAQKTRQAIFRNLFFSASFNIISGTLAILGLMTPLWAAVLMPVSSITVLVSAMWTGNQLMKEKGNL